MTSWVQLRRNEIAALIVKAERAVVDAAMAEHALTFAFHHDLRSINARRRLADATKALAGLYEDRDEYAAMEVA